MTDGEASRAAKMVSASAYWWWFLASALGLAMVCYVVMPMVFAPSRASSDLASAVLIEPALINWSDREIREHELVQTEFTIRNTSASPVTLTKIAASCTCSTVVQGDDGEPPFSLGPGASVKCTMSTVARAETGKQRLSLIVESEGQGHRLPTTAAALILYVRGKLRALPAEVALGRVAPDKPITRKITLADTLKTNPVGISRIEVSRPELIEVTHRPAARRTGPDSPFLARHELLVTLKPTASDKRMDETISVRLDDGSTLTIPVYGSVAQPYEFAPGHLTIRGLRSGEVAQRKVFYTFSDPAESALELVAAPENVHVAILPFSKDKKVLDISCTMPPGANDVSYEVTLVAGSQRTKVRFPLTLSRSDPLSGDGLR